MRDSGSSRGPYRLLTAGDDTGTVAGHWFDGPRGLWFAVCTARAMAAVGIPASVLSMDSGTIFDQRDGADDGPICTHCHPELCSDPAGHWPDQVMSRERFGALNDHAWPRRRPLHTQFIVLRGAKGFPIPDRLNGMWYAREALTSDIYLPSGTPALAGPTGTFHATGRVERRRHDSDLAEIYEYRGEATERG